MTANDIMYRVRLYIGDTYKSKVSDWEIINSINDALRLMAEESARLSGDLFRISEDLTITEGSCSLPGGYLRLIKAFGDERAELFNVHTDAPSSGEFSIAGGKLYSGESAVELWYFGYPDDVIAADSAVDLPDSMAVPLARITSLLLANKIEDAVTMADYFIGAKTERPAQKR